jgi:GNAT superfamily N-acetyltransferase
MRAHAEATWGYWAPAKDPQAHVAAFDPTHHLIVEVGGKPVGLLAYEDRDDCVYLTKLYLLPTHRGAGLGARLLFTVFDVARQRGRPHVRLHTLLVNRRAISFYERHGFSVESSTTERTYMVASTA